jgi:hypothetical protein
MRILAIFALALGAVVASPTALAGPHGGRGGAYASPNHGYGGGRWVGGPYRPWYGPGYGYGGWRYGYPGYGYARYGYPGYGFGLGLGYGAGWALTAGSPWYWGAPYATPAFYPYGYMATPYPGLLVNEDVTYVQQGQADIVEPPQPARKASWYYCTEPAGYHPYVQQCSRPWIAVQPQSVPPAGGSQPVAPVR